MKTLGVQTRGWAKDAWALPCPPHLHYAGNRGPFLPSAATLRSAGGSGHLRALKYPWRSVCTSEFSQMRMLRSRMFEGLAWDTQLVKGRLESLTWPPDLQANVTGGPHSWDTQRPRACPAEMAVVAWGKGLRRQRGVYGSLGVLTVPHVCKAPCVCKHHVRQGCYQDCPGTEGFSRKTLEAGSWLLGTWA